MSHKLLSWGSLPTKVEDLYWRTMTGWAEKNIPQEHATLFMIGHPTITTWGVCWFSHWIVVSYIPGVAGLSTDRIARKRSSKWAAFDQGQQPQDQDLRHHESLVQHKVSRFWWWGSLFQQNRVGIHPAIYMQIQIYIYIYRERERHICLCIYIYICILKRGRDLWFLISWWSFSHCKSNTFI